MDQKYSYLWQKFVALNELCAADSEWRTRAHAIVYSTSLTSASKDAAVKLIAANETDREILDGINHLLKYKGTPKDDLTEEQGAAIFSVVSRLYKKLTTLDK